MRAAALFIARYESRHFTFEGVGETEAAARAALKTCIVEHCRQYREAMISPRMFKEEVADGATVRQITAGHGYRDREQITPHP